MATTKKAFRCTNCGHLYHAHHAGENAVPASCPVCHQGVTISSAGWKHVPDHWEVLANATAERLSELGLTPDDVERHVPLGKGEPHTPQVIERFATDGSGVKDEAN